MIPTPRPNPFQRLVRRLAATRVGTRLGAGPVRLLDRLVARASGGRQTFAGLAAGLPIVFLTTTGARSGIARTTPLIGIPHGDAVALIASNFGGTRRPAWYHNLRTHPEATVAYRGRTLRCRARPATPAEHAQVWRDALRIYPGYAAYRRRARTRQLPILILEASPAAP